MAFDTIQKIVKPTTKYTVTNYTLWTSAASVYDGISFYNMWNGLLGSTNGTTYGTFSHIIVPMAVANYTSINASFYFDTAFNQSMTMQCVMVTADTSSLATYNVVATLLSVTIPTTNGLRFVISDGLGGEGGIIGGSTAAAQALYRIIPGAACPYLAFTFSAGSAPASGAFFNIYISRSA